jgi:hypothetical protein
MSTIRKDELLHKKELRVRESTMKLKTTSLF